ncbi:MAG TPA: isopentenyl-diphosphate Delta-isomerase [Cyanobacteria bacterium UBA8156]|jgi:isopentenyl-diphosphate delta-isomerase|nr:isopentenyl-diphosphate Delta-isomerase [Cyanobacteria bacterium UBA8156]
MERVVLVDDRDRALGTEEKLAVHRTGECHRAFSVFVWNDRQELLLQRRALTKYHAGGLWTNTCCSHPRPGELPRLAAHRRLQEEMGFGCALTHQFTFTYRADLGDGWWEHECDWVFFGRFEGVPAPDPAEAMDWRWLPWPDLQADVAAHPDRYTPWLRLALPRVATAWTTFFDGTTP